MGDIPVELIASDYKDFGGILEPAKVTQKTGPQEFTITLDSVEVNQGGRGEKILASVEMRCTDLQEAKTL